MASREETRAKINDGKRCRFCEATAHATVLSEPCTV